MPNTRWVSETQATATFSVSASGRDVVMCTGILIEQVEEHRTPGGEPLRGRRRWRILDLRGPALRHPTAPLRDELFDIVLADGRRGSGMIVGSTMTGSGPLA